MPQAKFRSPNAYILDACVISTCFARRSRTDENIRPRTFPICLVRLPNFRRPTAASIPDLIPVCHVLVGYCSEQPIRTFPNRRGWSDSLRWKAVGFGPTQG